MLCAEEVKNVLKSIRQEERQKAIEKTEQYVNETLEKAFKEAQKQKATSVESTFKALPESLISTLKWKGWVVNYLDHDTVKVSVSI